MLFFFIFLISKFLTEGRGYPLVLRKFTGPDPFCTLFEGCMVDEKNLTHMNSFCKIITPFAQFQSPTLTLHHYMDEDFMTMVYMDEDFYNQIL